MSVSCISNHPASRRSVKEADLDQVRLDHLLDRLPVFTHGGGNRADADRPAAKLLDYRHQDLAVHLVKPVTVDLHNVECGLGKISRHTAVGGNLCKVPYSPQQAVGDSRCPTRTPCKLQSSARFDFDAENL